MELHYFIVFPRNESTRFGRWIWSHRQLHTNDMCGFGQEIAIQFILLSLGFRFLFASILWPFEWNVHKHICGVRDQFKVWIHELNVWTFCGVFAVLRTKHKSKTNHLKLIQFDVRSGRFRKVTRLRRLLFGCDKFIHWLTSFTPSSHIRCCTVICCLIYSEIWN